MQTIFTIFFTTLISSFFTFLFFEKFRTLACLLKKIKLYFFPKKNKNQSKIIPVSAETNGVEYDSIRKDLLICHQNRVWQLIQYSITIQTAFIAGWYYALFEAEKPHLALMATIFSLIIMLLLLQALDRYNHLMNKASSGLKNIYYTKWNREIWLDTNKPPKDAGKISQHVMLLIIFSNSFLAGLTIGIWI